MEAKSNPLLMVSVAVYGGLTLVLLFLPQEALGWLGVTASDAAVAIVQLLSGGLFALTLLNWMSRYSRLGGIFGRPLLIANVGYLGIAAPTLVRLVLALDGSPPVMGLLLLHVLLLLGFGAKLFGPTPSDGP